MSAPAEDGIARIVKRLALVFAVSVGTGLPGGYFGLQYSNRVEHLEIQAQLKAEGLSSLVAANPELWVYQLQRAEELLQRYPPRLADDRAIVRDAAGNLLIAVGASQSAPVLVRSSPIYDSGRVVGQVEITHTYRDVVFGTLVAGLLGLLLGVLVYATLLVLPLRALRRVTAALIHETAALDESASRYRAVAETANDAIITADGAGTIIGWNPAAGRTFGYTESEAVGQPVTLVMPQRYRDRHVNGIGRIQAGGERRVIGRSVEMHGLTKDGREFPLEMALSEWETREGRFFAGIIRDITERREAELALARQKDLYDMLSQTNQAIVRITSREELFSAVCRVAVEHGRFRFAWIGLMDKDDPCPKVVARHGEDAGYIDHLDLPGNSANASMRGLAGKALLSGAHVISNDFLYDPETAPWREAARRAGVRASAKFPIRQGGAVIGAISLYAGDPGYFTEGLVATIDEMATDVSFALDNFARDAARQRAERALREGEERYRQLFAANPHPMWVFDTETLGFLAVNDAALGHYGWSRGEFLSMTLADIRPAEDIPAMLGRLATDQEHEFNKVYGARHRKKDGTLIDVEISSHAMDFGGRRARVSTAIDITERKLAEQRLVENRALLQAIINGTPDAIYVKDPQGRYLLLNIAAEGYAGKSASDALGKDDSFLFPPAEAATIMESDRKVLESGTVATYEERATDATGRVLTFLATKGPILDASGKLIGLFGVSRDITGRKAMEEELRESAAFRELLLQAMPLPVFHKDASGRYTGCNRAFSEFIGKSRNDIVGKTVFEVSPQHFSQTYRDKDLELLDNPAGMQVYESRVVHADGTAHDVIFHKARIADNTGRPTGIVGAIADITENKRAQEALRESDARYRNLFESNEAVMLLVDPADGRIVEANPAACAYYGYEPAVLQGMKVYDINVLTRDQVRAEVDRVLRREKSHLDFRHRLASGEVRDVEVFISPIEVGGRKLFFSIVQDVTERLGAERQLVEAEARFRGLVEQSIAGIYIIQDGVFAYVNPRLAEIRGFGSADEIIGRDPLQLIAENDRAAVAEFNRRLLAGEMQSVDHSFIGLRKDGSGIEVGVHSALATYRGRPAIIGLMQDISEKKRAEEQIKHYIAQLENAFMKTVEVATTLSEMRDPYTAGHERRVAEIAVAISAELGFDARRQEGLRVAGYLHDIGKITIPAEILAKPAKLTPLEYQLIKGHAQASYDVLKNVDFPWPVAEIALQHHERVDGSGYPQGLKGGAILLEARILAVADVIEAMSSHRPYRPGLGIAAALSEIERGRGAAYDADVADACLRLFREKGYAIPA